MITLILVFYIYLSVMSKLGFPPSIGDYIFAVLLTFLTFLHLKECLTAYRVSGELAKQLERNKLNASKSDKEEFFDKIT